LERRYLHGIPMSHGTISIPTDAWHHMRYHSPKRHPYYDSAYDDSFFWHNILGGPRRKASPACFAAKFGYIVGRENPDALVSKCHEF